VLQAALLTVANYAHICILLQKIISVCVCVGTLVRVCVRESVRVRTLISVCVYAFVRVCACLCVRTECRFACQHLQLEVAAHRTLIARVLQQVMVPVAYDRETFITFQAQHQQKLRAGITYRARHAINDM